MTYLQIWSENKEINYIPVNTFKNKYSSFSSKIYSIFFESGEIYYDAFFQFVCIILFLNPTHIMQLFFHISKYTVIFVLQKYILLLYSFYRVKYKKYWVYLKE